MGVSVGPSGGGKRNTNFDLDLVPFIDLLSTCILFLLVTVVWVEISRMSAFSQAGGETVVKHSDVSNLSPQREDRDWDVFVRTDGIEFVEDGRSISKVQKETLYDEVVRLKSKISNPNEFKISIRAADDVIYEDVVMVLDALFTAELFNVKIGGIN